MIRKPKTHARSSLPSRALIPFLVLLASAFLAGCFGAKEEPRMAGGDDIPNDVEPLGKKSARERGDSAEWNGFKTMPRTSPGMYDTTTVIDSIPDTTGSGEAQPKAAAPGAAQAKRGALGPADEEAIPPVDDLARPLDTVTTKVVDTVKGTLETVHTQVKDSIAKWTAPSSYPPIRPTRARPLACCRFPAGSFSRTRRSGGPTASAMRTATGSWPRATGSLNLADLDVGVKGADGLVRRTVQRVAAGADLDFNGKGDNRVLSSLVVTTLGADTLDVFRLLDADGDSIVLDFGKDTNLVDLIEEHRNPSDPSQVSVSVQARLVVFSKDSTRNYAVRYQRTVHYADGSVLAVTTRGAGADSSFRAGGDAVWTETLALPPGDSLRTRARAFTVRLAQEPGAFQGNMLNLIAVEERYANLPYGRFAFELRPERPVTDGGWPAAGAVNASLEYREGGTVSFTGEAVPGGMEGSVTTSSGLVIPIYFERNGAATRR